MKAENIELAQELLKNRLALARMFNILIEHLRHYNRSPEKLSCSIAVTNDLGRYGADIPAHEMRQIVEDFIKRTESQLEQIGVVDLPKVIK